MRKFKELTHALLTSALSYAYAEPTGEFTEPLVLAEACAAELRKLAEQREQS